MKRTYMMGLSLTCGLWLSGVGMAAPLSPAVPADGRPAATGTTTTTTTTTTTAAPPPKPPTTAKPIGPGRPETVRAADAVRPTNPARQVVRPGPASEVVRPAPTGVGSKSEAAADAVSRPAPGRARPGGDAEQARLPGAPATTAAPPPSPPRKLKLAPSAAEIESERRPTTSDSPPPAVDENGRRDPRDGTPRQDPRSPTRVDHTRGPGSPVGAGTAGDRKGTLEDASGPQQGVIRNRW